MSEKREKEDWDASCASKLERLPCVAEIRTSSEGPIYLVGGAVRDLIQGIEPTDLDFAVDGPLESTITAIGGEVTRFPQFFTASVLQSDGSALDIARTRKEVYEAPGALPQVEPARIEEDLQRRDFTINAMAVDLDEPEVLIDPLDGRGDLAAGVLRALHPKSLTDDPTRAFRAARYAARLGLEPDQDLVDQLARVDLSTITKERLDNEIHLCAQEECESGALAKAADWELISIAPSDPQLLTRICEVFNSEPWSRYLARVGSREADVLDRVVTRPDTNGELEALESAKRIMARQPGDPAAIGEIASGEDPGILVIARALGANWLDAWPERLSAVRLTIGGSDLLEVGVPAGPLVGVGLAAALEEKMNGNAERAEDEMQAALSACRSSGWEPGPR